MAGFFPHLGVLSQSFVSLPMSSFATLLDDIVADVATGGAPGVNGWTLYDDQRAGGGEIVLVPNGGYSIKSTSYDTPSWTNNSQTLNWEGNTQGHYGFWAQPGLTEVSTDKTDWYTINTFVSHNQVTVNRNYTGTTGAKLTYTKLGGYIVLKCQSEQKIFYVKITRTKDYQSPCRIQVFETWNAVTHTGTMGGPEEMLRAYDWPLATRSGANTKIQYSLFLLPDALALWIGADPGEMNVLVESTTCYTFWDLFYVGNLIPSRNGDTNALFQACSNQSLSGLGAYAGTIGSSTEMSGGASCLRNVAGMPWWNPQSLNGHAGHALYAPWPRGMTALYSLDRLGLDDAGKFQFCEVDAYHTGTSIVTGVRTWEGKRGELRHLRLPISNPTGMNLVAFGPCDDGNTYILLRVSRPTDYDRSYDLENNLGYNSGFARSARTGSYGELEISGNHSMNERFFLLPINI